jgi:hypothetical protein
MSDDLPPVPPDLVADLESLAESLADRPDNADASRKLEWLLDALIMRGQLPASFRRLVTKIRADRGSTVRLAVFQDKYSLESPDIDCAARIPLCGARCCRFAVTLSSEDVAERVLPFDIQHPYELPRDPDTKKCVCMDDAGACTVYDKRPGTCRVYDCRHDSRVWIDYDARIPAPMPAHLESTRLDRGGR